MPGIAGIILATTEAVASRHLETMVGALTQEPGDTSGTYENTALGAHIGWTQRPGTFSDCLPVWNETRDVCLFLAGEVYTDAAQLSDLRSRGHRFHPGDASHLVHLYEEGGASFIDDLNGWFSGLLIDIRRSITILFNDRYGMGRVYLHHAQSGLYFSSNASSLLQVLPGTRRLDADSLAETFSFGCVIQNRTLFQGISLLPPGSRWTIDSRGVVERGTYFDVGRWEEQETLPDEEFYGRFKETFRALLPQYIGASGTSAMSLTGGLDGRMIMAWANAEPGALPCYSFGSTYRDCQDVRLARDIAQACQQPHRTLTVGGDMLARFPELATRCIQVSSGAMDVTGAVELYVNRQARAISPVRVTGNYGSEIVRGSVAFRPRRLASDILHPEFQQRVATAEATFRTERMARDLTFIAFKQVPWHHHARLAVELSQLTVRSPYLDNRLVELMYRASPSVIGSRETSLRFIHEGRPILTRIPTDRGYRYPQVTLLDKLNQAWLDFTFKAEYAYDYGMPRRLTQIDNALSALRLERIFLGRHKFYHFRTWYRRQLAPYIRDTLLSPSAAVRSYFHGNALNKMVEDHIRGAANNTLDIHRALTVELVHRHLLDDNTRAGREADKRAAPRRPSESGEPAVSVGETSRP